MRGLTIILAVGSIFYFAIDSTLQDMTRHDCEVNKIEKACLELQK